MSKLFEELDFRPTPLGALILRRRLELKTGEQVYEIKLGEEFLMSSMFTASEIALANLGIKHLNAINPDIVVGGLGLGYTARAVLQHDHVNSLTVVDTLAEIIDWHETGLLPLGPELTGDKRCSLRHDDFFALATSSKGFGKKLDAILVDIDHSPDFFLNATNAEFYKPHSLAKMAEHLNPNGIFGLWSDDKPDPQFVEILESVFDKAWAEPVTFYNPLQNRNFTQSVYLARTKS